MNRFLTFSLILDAGGYENTISGGSGSINGGRYGWVQEGTSYGTILGGYNRLINDGTLYEVVTGE